MTPVQLHPETVEFILLSFEGPDQYSQAGGLGVRVTNLGMALAEWGFSVHLFFVGDPNLPGYEERCDGRLRLYRWCQWISQYHPNGVYDGEEDKLADFTASVPPFVIEQIVRPAFARRRHVVVLAEDWQTANPLIALSDQLHQAGLREYAVLLWNANNTMGFERIDWPRLSFVSTLTTVSRYMKQLMRPYGLDPLIIPNGIPADLLNPVDPAAIQQVHSLLRRNGEILLFKVGRFDPAKCWWMAVEAAAQLKHSGHPIAFALRGGIEPHGAEVLKHAYELGLSIRDVRGKPQGWREAVQLIQSAIQAEGPADIYNFQFFMPQPILRPFYAAADVTLANSKHEPFGLVGLEAMAAGGIVFTGSTGETYSANGEGAIALDTETAEEIVLQTLRLRENPERARAIRRAAWRTAAQFTWNKVLEVLFDKIQLSALWQHTRPLARSTAAWPYRVLTQEWVRLRTSNPPRPYPRLEPAPNLHLAGS